ncbi:MAG: hypothetical protein JNG85_01015 [Spirochaetaceae bacterium]|nr:hypothetical protein [Spirochaetaceae bacterium]
MKKLLALLLALVVVGGVVFAQDAAPVSKVTGYFYNTSVLFNQDSKQVAGPDWLSAGHYGNIGFSYAAKEFGFSGTIEFENAAVNSAFRDYTAWVKPFGDILKVSAGKLRNGDYRLTSYVDGSGFNTRLANAEYGYMIQAYPVAGLSLGFFNNVTTTATAPDMKVLGFGASYTITDIAKLVVAYKGSLDELFIGADIKAVKGLTAKLGFVNDSTTGADFNRIWATAGYALMDGALDLGLDAYYKMETTTTVNTLWAKVQAAYTIGNITPSVYFDIKNVSSPAATTEDVGAQLKFAAGDNGALYLGVDVGLGGATTTWSVPLTVEVSF